MLFWHLVLEKPSCLRAKAQPHDLSLLEIGEVECKLLSDFLAVPAAWLHVFPLHFLLSIKESLCNGSISCFSMPASMGMDQGRGLPKTTRHLDGRPCSAEYYFASAPA